MKLTIRLPGDLQRGLLLSFYYRTSWSGRAVKGKTRASFISRMLALSMNRLWSPHRSSWTRYAYIIDVRVYAWVGVRFTGKSLAIQSRRIAQGRDTALRAPVDLHRELYFCIRSEHNLYFNRSPRRISAARKTWADSPFKQRQRLVEHATFPCVPKDVFRSFRLSPCYHLAAR